MADPACRVCGNETGNRVHVVREMMYGTRKAFSYSECATCSRLQILEVPKDLPVLCASPRAHRNRQQLTFATKPTFLGALTK
jgi:hypothetical protein